MISHIKAILWKQIKDTLKNKEVLVQFVMFPIMTIVMEYSIDIPHMPNYFFTNLFAIMYIGMSPLTSTAAIISEEKEKNTLCVLQMYNIKAIEYLMGNAIYILSICMIGSLIMGVAGGYTGVNLLKFMLFMLLGHSCGFLLGAAIGIASKNQMMATSVTVPVMLLLSFLPMLSMFNDTIKKYSKYIFSEQLYLLINHLEKITITLETGGILLCNIVLVVTLFFVVYKKEFFSR